MRRFASLALLTILAGLTLSAVTARGADAPPEIPLTIEKNRFQPEEVKVKAGTPFVLVVTNKDGAAAEFESKELRIEKVVPAGKTVKVRVRALPPGTYPFLNDYRKETKGRIVAE